MRRVGYTILLFVIGIVTYGQNLEVELLIKKGVTLHDKGFYEEALDKFEKALEVEPLNTLAHYEISYTYMMLKKWDDAYYHSRQVILDKKDYWVEAIMVNGAALDNLDRSKKAIKQYKKALNRYPDHYLLNYNLAVSCLNAGELADAESAVQRAIKSNRQHMSSHLLLANVMMQQGERFKSVLPLYYFLLHEQDTERSIEAWEMMQVIWLNAAIQNKGSINISLASKSLSSEIGAVELAIGAIASNYLMHEEKKNLPEPQQLVEKTKELFRVMSEMEINGLGFWELVYLDYFKAIEQQGHTESMTYYISNCKYKAEVLTWITENGEDFQKFMNWMELQP